MRTLTGIAKGMTLGAANVLTVAWAVGEMKGGVATGGAVAEFIIQLGILPGLVVGAGLGAVGARLGENRRFVMLFTALASVLALGVVLEASLIPFATVTTTALVLVLELWTRSHVPAPTGKPLPIGLKGALVGIANSTATAAVLGTYATFSASFPRGVYFDHGMPRGMELGVEVALLGALPTALVGACLGWILHALRGWRPGSRLALIVPVAVGGVWLLGSLGQEEQLILPAALVAAASVIALERWTRPLPEAVAPMRVVRAAASTPIFARD